MNGLANNKVVALGVALAIGLVAVYVNSRYDHGTATQIDAKAERGMSATPELALPHDLWPRQ